MIGDLKDIEPEFVVLSYSTSLTLVPRVSYRKRYHTTCYRRCLCVVQACLELQRLT